MPTRTHSAPRVLSRIRQEIIEATQELGAVRSERVQLLTGNEELRKEVSVLQEQRMKILGEIADAERRLAAVPLVEAHTSLVEQEVKTEKAKADEAEAREVLVDIHRKIEKHTDRATKTETEANHQQKRKDKLTGDVASLEVKKGRLQNEISAEDSRLEKKKKERQAVAGAIQAALDNFKIYENRISTLAEQTGYTVSYERPAKLVTKD